MSERVKLEIDVISPCPLLAVSSRMLPSPMMAAIVKRLYPGSGDASNRNELYKAQSMKLPLTPPPRAWYVTKSTPQSVACPKSRIREKFGLN